VTWNVSIEALITLSSKLLMTAKEPITMITSITGAIHSDRLVIATITVSMGSSLGSMVVSMGLTLDLWWFL